MGWETYILKKGNAVTFPKRSSKVKGTSGRKGIGFLMALAVNTNNKHFKTIINVTSYTYANCVPYLCTKEEFEKDCDKLVKRFYQQCSSKYDFKGFKVYASNGRRKGAVIVGRGDLITDLINKLVENKPEEVYNSELRCEI